MAIRPDSIWTLNRGLDLNSCRRRALSAATRRHSRTNRLVPQSVNGSWGSAPQDSTNDSSLIGSVSGNGSNRPVQSPGRRTPSDPEYLSTPIGLQARQAAARFGRKAGRRPATVLALSSRAASRATSSQARSSSRFAEEDRRAVSIPLSRHFPRRTCRPSRPLAPTAGSSPPGARRRIVERFSRLMSGEPRTDTIAGRSDVPQDQTVDISRGKITTERRRASPNEPDPIGGAQPGSERTVELRLRPANAISSPSCRPSSRGATTTRADGIAFTGRTRCIPAHLRFRGNRPVNPEQVFPRFQYRNFAAGSSRLDRDRQPFPIQNCLNVAHGKPGTPRQRALDRGHQLDLALHDDVEIALPSDSMDGPDRSHRGITAGLRSPPEASAG